MAAITLPDSPGPRNVEWELVDFGGILAGALGGPDQRVNRLGNRWRAVVEMPPLTSKQAREWSAALVKGVRLGVLWEIVQPGFSSGVPGRPLVAGPDQSGWGLEADTFTPGYVWRPGQFMSVITSGQRYLYQFSEAGRVETDGTATLPIEPALRVSPADDDTIEVVRPVMQGLIAAPSWSYDIDKLGRGFSFTITESR